MVWYKGQLNSISEILMPILVFISFAHQSSSDAVNNIVYGNNTYEMRLIGGKTQYHGRLEIRRNNGSWGTIKGSNWSSRHARVACRSLGFSSSVLSPYIVKEVGVAIGPVHLNVIRCLGTESSLLECRCNEWESSADHSADIGLHCLPENQTLTLRLTQKTNNYTGVLEVYDGVSRWGNICGGQWSFYSADVACRQLGYASALSGFSRIATPDTVSYLLNVKCGSQFKEFSSLDQCVYSRWEHSNYQSCSTTSNNVVGVVCSDSKIDYSSSELRLWGTSDRSEGVVQIKEENTTVWRTMCFSKEISINDMTGALGDTLCHTITGYGRHSISEMVDECSMAPLVSNVSHIALVGPTTGIYDDALKHDVLNFLNISPSSGTCSDYGHFGVYLVCSKEVQYENEVIIVSPDSTCQGRCGYQPGTARCRCDPQCEVFQDCCYDYHDACHSSLNMVNETGTLDLALFVCTPLDRDFIVIGSVMLVAVCPGNWTNEFIKHGCEKLPPLYADPAERLWAEWAVSDENGENFRNIFCAICNGKDFGDILPWDVMYPPDSPFNTAVQQTHKHCEDRHELGRLGRRLRYCFPSWISSCPLPRSNESIAKVCESYSNHMCSTGLVGYKNYHCALCHGVNINSLGLCVNTQVQGTAVLQRIWKFKENSPTTNGIVERCANKDTVYDPYTRTCRSLSCPPGYTLNSELKCNVANGKFRDSGGLCCQQQLSWIFVAYDKTPNGYESDTESNDENVLQFLRHLNISMSAGSSGWIKSRNFGLNLDKYLLQSDSECNLAGALDNILVGPTELISDDKHIDISYLFMCDNFPSTETCMVDWFNGTASEFVPVNITSVVAQVFLHNGQYVLPKFTLHQVTYKYDGNKDEFIKEERVQVCGEILHIPSCPLITLAIRDYTVGRSEKGSRTVRFGNISYEQGEYILYPDGRAQICATRFIRLANDFFAYSGYLALANVIGTGFSVSGLTATFVLHCCYRDLRNYQGRCVMSLCVFLFVAQLLPTVSSYVSFPNGVCVFVAIVSHYSWLGAFSWMSVIAFNIFHIFGRGSIQRTGDWESGPICRYLVPAFGFGVPLIPVSIAIGSNLYGVDSPCWISDSVRNFWAFGVPVGTFMVVNTVLFIATVVLVCRSQRRSRRLRVQEETVCTFLKDALLCWKIQIFMGITWTFGFLASFLDNEALWWMFILTNSLQGVFLLIICLCSSNFQDNVTMKSKPSNKKTSSKDDHQKIQLTPVNRHVII